MAVRGAMALAAALWLVVGCGDDTPVGGDAGRDGEAGVDARVDAGPDADAGRDADLPDCDDPIRQTFDWPPEPTEYDFCDDMLFKLPVDMRKEETGSDVELRGNDLLYTDRHIAEGEEAFALYYFDLATCRHYRVAWQEPQDVYKAAVWDHKVAVNWALPCSDSPTQFYVIDLGDWSYEQVTFDENGGGALTMAYNGRYLGWYGAFHDAPGVTHWETRVMDLQTGLYQEVADEAAYPDYMAASDTFLTWIEYASGSQGRRAVWYEQDEGQVHVIEQTLPYHQAFVTAWGRKVVGHRALSSVSGPYVVWVYDVDSGDYQEVAEEPILSPFPRPWKTVLGMNTSKYVEDPDGRYPRDIILLDTETGVERRVTREPGYVYLPGGFDPPWLVIGVYPGVTNRHNFWVLNVYEAGLIDEEGHVVPGDPVIDPPGFDD